MAKDPSLENMGWLALNLFDPSPVPWGASSEGQRSQQGIRGCQIRDTILTQDNARPARD